MDLTKGQAFIDKIEVLAPLNELQIAMTKRITAAETKTKFAAAVLWPITSVVTSTRKPGKTSVIPSATHSIVRMRILSVDKVPNPATTDLVGKTPQDYYC